MLHQVLAIWIYPLNFRYISLFRSVPLTSDRTRNHSEGWIPEAADNLMLEVIGCRDPPQTWCTEVGRIFLPQYIVALVFFAVGFSAASLTDLTIFSKILGPFPQVCAIDIVILFMFSNAMTVLLNNLRLVY